MKNLTHGTQSYPILALCSVGGRVLCNTFKVMCCHCVLSRGARYGAFDSLGLGAFQIVFGLSIPLQSTPGKHRQSWRAILHGLKMTSQQLSTEMRLLGKGDPSQHTQLSHLNNIGSNLTSLCSSTGFPQVVMTLTLSEGILVRVCPYSAKIQLNTLTCID